MKKLLALPIVFCILLAGCTDTKSRSTGVYMLLDTSGTYAVELKKAQKILNYLLGVMAPGDTLAVARIDTGSFSEKGIIAKAKFDQIDREFQQVFGRGHGGQIDEYRTEDADIILQPSNIKK